MCGRRHADRAADPQCDEEIDDDSVSISSKRHFLGLRDRPAKRVRVADRPAVKVSIFLEALPGIVDGVCLGRPLWAIAQAARS